MVVAVCDRASDALLAAIVSVTNMAIKSLYCCPHLVLLHCIGGIEHPAE